MGQVVEADLIFCENMDSIWTELIGLPLIGLTRIEAVGRLE